MGDYYRSTDDGYSTCAGDQHGDVDKILAKRLARSQLPESSILRDPQIRGLLKDEREQQETKALEVRMQDFVKTRMRRDNVSSLFQTPKVREDEATTAQSFQPIVGAESIDKEYFMKRDTFTDY